MKQCPTCSSLFPDGDRFCEVDGTKLVAARNPDGNPRDKSVLTLIGVIGVCVGVSLVFLYLTFLRGNTTPEVSSNSNASAQPQLATMLQPVSSPAPSESPSIEPSPSPSVQVSPSPQPSATPVELSSSPIAATAAPPLTSHVVITLVSGAKIEAEEAWQTGEGIWYRKGTVVSLLDPKTVKSIDKVATAVPAPTVTKSSSP
ncbi:MAG TPA: hypothetical protein VLA93_04065 [Pyrinomonadaceae bacterium]|nr:hypothetical protein [Pyrinomonadaceae bacterium]